MSNPYSELFKSSGAVRFSLAGFIARMPLPMTGIGIIAMLSQLSGSYGLAGSVSATFVLTYALISPQISRLVDRYGQYFILPITTAISVLGIFALLACAHWQAPIWILFLCAILAGFMPSMSAMVRARWTVIYRGQPQLQTAYSLETVFDEISFILGPPISIGLSVALFPQAGPLVAALLLAVGVCFFVMFRKTEPPVEPRKTTQETNSSIIKIPAVWILSLLFFFMGIIVGTVDIVSVAFAEQLGHPAAVSLVLSAYAIGSCLAGLIFGAIKLKTPLYRLFIVGGLGTALTTVPFLIVSSISGLALTVFIAGLFFAPTMILSMALIEKITPEKRLTEGLTWLLSGLNTGVALGATMAGQSVDIYGSRGGFIVSLIAGIGVILIICYGYFTLFRLKKY
ncbi:MFS transporter [Xenorhabdus innexi]|uniref:MFS transporter n=1 Tax=Xenorhabdus innexi TaxID=290109 RepID=A0A1N6MUP1_9GAMM|nr:MFS transporter [Xenorhabdus innexi]PHM31138.1 MFS transporter [Xenorhabdus innexi]SIP72603.1 putative Transporter [Xenorhabdus innexi]